MGNPLGREPEEVTREASSLFPERGYYLLCVDLPSGMGGLCQGKLRCQGVIDPFPTGLNIFPTPPVRAASAVIGQVASRCKAKEVM
ncbi:MAG TPA: hypothetical protein VMX96_00150 [Dehalococcoidia bacterium]|nr:hypothetical protein [Dehalococcoidia bacterium]